MTAVLLSQVTPTYHIINCNYRTMIFNNSIAEVQDRHVNSYSTEQEIIYED